MLYWIPIAFVRIVVFFIAGILLGIFYPALFPLSYTTTACVLLIALYFLLWFINRMKKRVVVNSGFIGLIIIFLAGYVNPIIRNEKNQPQHLTSFSLPGIDYFTGTVVAPAQEKETFWKQEIRVTSVRVGEQWQVANGNIIVYFSRKSFSQPFHYGDDLILKGKLLEIPPAKNPGEFDYQKFLSYKNIFHQCFLSGKDAILISSQPSNKFMAFSFQIRDWANQKLCAVVDGRQERAIASALVLGIVDGLDNEISAAYAATGAMHVLAVSGLHIAIVYLLLGFLIRPLIRIKYGKWAIAMISLVVLWGYACITGLSPSVLRAVMMFSFVAVAKPLNQRTNIYNTLGASAFCLLVYDPFLIMSVGFQLSYLAVIGIVYLQPLIYNWFEPDNRLIDETWKITSVSIAAQLVTFPICIFYFHQFPNYSLISNLFVIPLAFAILIGGLAVVAVSPVDIVYQFSGYLLELMIKLMNYLIFLTEKLPFAVIPNLQISAFQCLIIMSMVIFVVLAFQFRKIKFFYAVAFLMATLGTTFWIDHFEIVDRTKFTVYTIKGHTAYEICENNTAYFFCDSALETDANSLRFHIAPIRMIRHVADIHDGKRSNNTVMLKEGSLSCWKGRTILQLDSFPFSLPDNLQIDYLILSGKTIYKAEKVLKKIKAKQVILDSSNSYFVTDKIFNSLTGYQIHSVWHQGAFDINL